MTPLIDSLRTARASQTGVVLDAKTLALLLAEIDALAGVKAAPLTIEVGKCYRTRDGQKAGPIIGTDWPALVSGPLPKPLDGGLWNVSDGTFGDRDDEDQVIQNDPNLDLVAEWVEPAPAIDPAPDAPAPAPDYNDGEIHIWRGGERPVHPESEVRAWFRDGDTITAWAGNESWMHLQSNPDSDIIAFQVTRQHVEPAPLLECWVNVYDHGIGGAWKTREKAIKFSRRIGNPIRTAVHMREVRE